jgi:hypothetical protein
MTDCFWPRAAVMIQMKCRPTRTMQLTAQTVTWFAVANRAPDCSAGDRRCYVTEEVY